MTYEITGACVPIEFAILGPIENNVYFIGGSDALVVVDPTCHPDELLRVVGTRKVAAIVLTHDHWDHVGAAKALRDATGAPVIASAVDARTISGEKPVAHSHRSFEPCSVDQMVAEGDTVETGPMKWRVLETPGHTPGSICLFLDPQYGSAPGGPAGSATGGGATGSTTGSAPVLISGDTLFRGTHGRTDFEGGDPAAMAKSLKKLALLPEDTIVLPGHNAPTTIGAERAWLQTGGVVR